MNRSARLRHDPPRLSVIGLGKLGSPMAAIFACKGYEVVGVDVAERNVRAINERQTHLAEPQLQQFLDATEGRLKGTFDYADAVHASDVTFIIVPTPSDRNGEFSNRFVLEAVNGIATALREKNDFHLVVLTSTVMPGSTGGEIRQALEAASGRRVGRDVGLCYSPEFIALGSVIRDMLNPDFILIGESDPLSGDILESIHRTVCDNDPPIHRMNLINAEICKISVNTYVTMKISYANMVAELCDKLADADANVVTSAVGADSRIGTKYLRGAIGYGGPCFPRDNKAFAAIGRRLGVCCDLAEATDKINDHQLDRLWTVLEQNIRPSTRIVVLGLSYKPDTDVVEESQGLAIARFLAQRGLVVTVYDPMAEEVAAATLGDTVIYAPTMQEAAHSGDMLVVMTAWREFSELSGDMLRGDDVVIVDPWRIVDPARFAASTRVIYPGRTPG
jgi:UDPglucose 6-dehydrogenase